MKNFNVREFRQRLKEALDLAAKGEDVVIRRDNEVFILKVPFNPKQYE